jgi:hypothetical protein
LLSSLCVCRYICMFHFAELQSLDANATRQFYITINGKLFYRLPVTPDHLFTNIVYNTSTTALLTEKKER